MRVDAESLVWVIQGFSEKQRAGPPASGDQIRTMTGGDVWRDQA